MNQPPRVTVTITVADTHEQHVIEYADAADMMISIEANLILAEMAYQRPIELRVVGIDEDLDDAYFTCNFSDNDELYANIWAHRHTVQ